MTPDQKLALSWQGLWFCIYAGIAFAVPVALATVLFVSPFRDKKAIVIIRAILYVGGVLAAAVLLVIAWHLEQL